MTDDRPAFVSDSAPWETVTMRFNSLPIALHRTEADPRQLTGWTDNPRVELVIKRWRNKNQNHMSTDVVPDDETMLALMLDDDDRNKSAATQTFAIAELGEDVKRNGVRDPIIVSWDGKLLDGNRRKFAVMWALSPKGGSNSEHHKLLSTIPVYVLRKEATSEEEQSILIQENYAPSLKKQWPEVVTNGALHTRYFELLDKNPNSDDLDIRRLLRDEFPRFSVSEIMYRIETWGLIEEFRAEHGGAVDEDDLDAKINERFQFFRQANDTFRKKNVFGNPEFKDLLFTGIMQGLFPSFASVRNLEDIYESKDATEIFLQGEGMARQQKSQNFRLARDVARRDRTNQGLTLNARLEEAIRLFEDVTSKQLTEISPEVLERLEGVLQRIIAQASASP